MSGFLLDTNIPSEVGRSRPNPRVAAWVNEQENHTLFLSAVSIGELRGEASPFSRSVNIALGWNNGSTPMCCCGSVNASCR